MNNESQKNNARKMQKLQGMATITKVEIPKEVAASNEENERLDVKLSFRYNDIAERSEAVNKMLAGIDASILAIAEKAGHSDAYTYLLDATRLGYDVDADADEVLEELKEKLENQQCVFTTYVVKVVDLLAGTDFATDGKQDFTAVHTETRAYTSFSQSYLLINDDADAVFDTVRARLLKRMGDKYEVGRTDEDVKSWKKFIKSQKSSDED